MITPVRFVSVANIALFSFYWIAAQLVLPEFAQFFTSFDAELPWLTRFVMESAGYWWLLLVVPLMEFYLSRRGGQIPGLLLVSNYLLGVLAVIFVPLVMLALYLPILEMGRVVAQ